MHRLGKNLGGYRGETIDIAHVLDRVADGARRHGWRHEDIATHGGIPLAALQRAPPRPGHHIYISTGIHGDEPAGPLAALELIERNLWPASAAITLLPCLNPTGFPLNRRENAAGIDLNREYHAAVAPEVRAHRAWLDAQPAFDLCLCLHEDWESNGFYLYELNPDARPSLAEKMIAAVAGRCPIDHAPMIEGRPARAGIIRPDTDPRSRPQWPEAFYLLTHKTRLSYTLEAPSDFSLATRVAALVTAVETAVENFAAMP
jgi:hypothetical protein